MLKTHLPDLPFANRLVASFQRFNTEHLTLHVVVPDAELAQFAVLDVQDVVLHGESVFEPHFTTEAIRGIAAEYSNQEVVKLAFWELGLCENYLCLDSNAVFIRPFGRADFMAAPGVPFTFLTEGLDLRVDPEYYRAHWQHRERMIREIQQAVGLETERLLTCHQHAVLSSDVLSSLVSHFMRPHGYSYIDLMRISPDAFSWYSTWLQKDQTIPIVMREPTFKALHSAVEHPERVLRGETEADLARGYVGVVLDSGVDWTENIESLDVPHHRILGQHVPPGELTRAALLRIYRQLPSLQRLVARLRRG